MSTPLQHKSASDRGIRSFVLRSGRMTAAQKKALADFWPQYGLSASDGLLDIEHCFGCRTGEVVLEIGFGMGDSLLAMAMAMAMANPEIHFIGVDVHKPGMGKLLYGLAQHQLDHVRVYCDDAVQVINRCIPKHSLSRIQIYFPDPWPKKKHHKRRLIQPLLVEQLRDRLKIGGVLHLATDWEPYARQMLEVLSSVAGLCNAATDQGFSPRPDYRPLTAFEKRGQRLGHGVWDVLFRRVS